MRYEFEGGGDLHTGGAYFRNFTVSFVCVDYGKASQSQANTCSTKSSTKLFGVYGMFWRFFPRVLGKV